MQIDNKKLSKRNTYLEKLLEKLGKLKDWEYAGKKEDCFSKSMKEHYSFVWPPHSSKCACGHVITKNCHIRNLNTNEIKVVGNCCIKKWNIEKKCIKCNEAHHRRDYIICGSCEKEECEEKKREEKLLKIGNKIISFGKHKNKTIKFIYKNYIGYAEWCFDEFDIDDNSTLKFRDISYYYEHMSDDDDENDDKIYLEVQFCEKEEAKKLGAMWDVEFKKWYIFNGDINKELILQKWKTCQKNCVENKSLFPGRLLDKKIIETITHKVYLEVPFCEKEDAKKSGVKWDSEFKKWYIFNENINKDLILQKWKVTIPDDQLLI